jgi:SpoVK/Ycf46/Vps4 family AAA+-type ATPase
MDRLVYVGPPDDVARAHIFNLHLSKMPHDEVNVNGDDLAARSVGHSGAEITAICREAALNAMGDNPEAVTSVLLPHFEKALAEAKFNITPEMLAFYGEYQSRGEGGEDAE